MMWLVYIHDLSQEKQIREELEEHLFKYYKTAVIQTIDHCIIALMGNCSYKYNEYEIAGSILTRRIQPRLFPKWSMLPE